MSRKITEEDIRYKGLPFQCSNCGAFPPADEVLRLDGVCDVCGDTIITYTVDTAELILRLQAKIESNPVPDPA